MKNVVLAAVLVVCGLTWAETVEVRGVVVDEADKPVSGAAVSLVGVKAGGAAERLRSWPRPRRIGKAASR